jgi:hypothetical protein
MTLGELLDLVNKGGVLLLLLLIPVGGHYRWYVFGWAYSEKCRECEQWRAIALRGLDVGQTLAGRIVERPAS